MAFINLNDYLNKVQTALYAYCGDVLAKWLSFRDPHVMSVRLVVDEVNMGMYSIDPPFDDIVITHLKTIRAVSKGDVVQAWKAQTQVVSAVAKMLSELKEENWMLPLMNVTCLDLRLFALAADHDLSSKGIAKPGETLEKAAETLMSCFRTCVADTRSSEENSKRWGLMYLVNQFLKIYFKINKLNLCKPMIRAIEALPFKDKYPLSQLVTYKYYTGRKAMFDSDFKAADAALSFAFEHCHRNSKKNKRRILLYLLPVKISIGYLPKESFLRKYRLPEFINIVKGVRDGNIRLLNESFEKNEKFFIRAGIYLILEKLKLLALRNLFKKIYLIKDNHQLDISIFVNALNWMNMPMDIDEAECIVANMIYDGKIKGYISHSHRKLVVSKKDAFPSLLVS